MKRLWIGCSGWAYDDWREPVYRGVPRRRWLERYAELFDTVEVNSTFYRLPERDTVAGWAEQTPPGFLFCCKASRYLTHIKRLKDARDGVRRLDERLEPLRESGKLGPTLWQLPGNFARDDERLEELIGAVTEGRHAIEFRHPSWFTADVYRRLAEADMALVIGDDPKRPFVERKLPASWTFIRFHRGTRGRRGNYSDGEIEQWRRRISAWRARKEVFAYFNNDWEAFAPRNAMKLAGGRLPTPPA
jgi:uncharacterized protein YecE (DUF72 family)